MKKIYDYQPFIGIYRHYRSVHYVVCCGKSRSWVI